MALERNEVLQRPEDEYTFGIPSRSDVKNPVYQEAIRLEELNERIGDFRWPTSTTFLHNHVVAVLRLAGENVFKASRIYETGDYRILLPWKRGEARRFKQLLDPKLVLETSLGSVGQYREAIFEAETHLSHMKDDDHFIETNHQLRNLPQGIKEEKVTLTWKEDTSGWRYTYNPWGLLTQELDSLEAELRASVDSEEHPVKQIHKLWSVISTHDEGTVKRLLSGSLRIRVERSSYAFEHDSKTEAGLLYQANQRVAAESDIYLRFDEAYLVLESLHVPFQEISGEEHQASQFGLFARTMARDYMESKLEEKGSLVVNGLNVQREHNRILSSSEIPLWLLDLFAQPVSVNGKVLHPEEWAIKEKEMDSAYRRLTVEDAIRVPLKPDVARILDTYTGFESHGGITSDKGRVNDLLYTLRRNDWRKLHKVKD